MIDFRLKTFLTLCRVLNYTKTAKILHITQPAVSQHIKYLEEEYGVKLFIYEGKNLYLTESGKILYQFTAGIESSSQRIKELIASPTNSYLPIHFGTTLTIGEYTMPEILSNLIHDFPKIHITMEVGNTKTLLNKLENGGIDFALLEGHFDKTKYNTAMFSKENFIGICSPLNPLSKESVSFEDIFKERLIVREMGSGSREIFEQILYEHNITMDNFFQRLEIGNINVIKDLVSQDLGITFLYEKAVEKELKDGSLSQINIRDFNVEREYNFAFLKYNLHNEEYINWLKYFKTHYNRE